MERRKMKQVLIVGSGDVARRIIPWLARRFLVRALVRRPEERDALRALGATPIVADLDRPASLARLAGIADYVLHCAPPPGEGQDDPRTRRLLAALMQRASLPRRLVYISTTGVYGDCAGAWLDETRPLRPASARAVRRVAAENRLRRFGCRSGCRVSVLRAPGIYDAEARLPLARLRKGEPVLAPEDDVFTNHIHADDLAAACLAALRHGGANRVYNVVDDSDLKMAAYFDRVADAFALPRPPRLSRDEAARTLSPLQWSFMRESRRIGNRRLKNELKLSLAYPTIEAGITEALARRSACSS